MLRLGNHPLCKVQDEKNSRNYIRPSVQRIWQDQVWFRQVPSNSQVIPTLRSCRIEMNLGNI